MKKDTLFWIIAAAILVSLVATRIYHFYGAITFLGDQGRDALIMRRIITLEHFPAIGAPSSVGQVYLGPFYYYLMAPFLPIFGMNPAGAAYGVFILSTLGIIAAFQVVRKFVSPSVSIVFLLLAAFSFPLVELSRFSWNPNLLPYFTFLTLFFSYQTLKRKNVWHAIAFGAFFGLSIQLHHLAAIMLLPILATYGYHIMIDRNDWKKYGNQILVAGASFLLVSTPLVIFDLRHDFLNSKQFLKLLEGGQLTAGMPYLARFNETVTAFFKHAFGISANILALQLLLWVGLGLGIWIAFQKKSQFLMLNVFTVALYLIGFAYLGSPRHAHYYGPIYLSTYLTLSAIPWIISNKTSRYILSIIFILGMIVFNIPKIVNLYNDSNQITQSKTVAESLKEHIGDQPFNISTWPVEWSEDPYLYFLENEGIRPADRKKLEITDQMFVVCEKEPCLVIDSPSWNISMFGPAQIADQWMVSNVTIYKLIHKSIK